MVVEARVDFQLIEVRGQWSEVVLLRVMTVRGDDLDVQYWVLPLATFFIRYMGYEQ